MITGAPRFVDSEVFEENCKGVGELSLLFVSCHGVMDGLFTLDAVMATLTWREVDSIARADQLV